MKNLMANVAMSGDGKSQGDQELVQAWKENYQDSHLMHRNIDLLAAKMGLKFYTPDS